MLRYKYIAFLLLTVSDDSVIILIEECVKTAIEVLGNFRP